MNSYTPRTFTIPTLAGISEKQLTVHRALYEGYVAHVNLIAEKLAAARNGELNLDAYIIAELRRRFAFEFDGMRMHEYYFEQFEHGPASLKPESTLGICVTEKYGSVDDFIAHIREVAATRGIGWVVVYFDPIGEKVHTTFVSDHEVGQLAGLPIILALDLWEHAFMVDYVPSEKKKYIDSFFQNIHWDICATRFENARNGNA